MIMNALFIWLFHKHWNNTNQVLNYCTWPLCRDFGFAQHALNLILLNVPEAEELKPL